jgi:hypothetical protein
LGSETAELHWAVHPSGAIAENNSTPNLPNSAVWHFPIEKRAMQLCQLHVERRRHRSEAQIERIQTTPDSHAVYINILGDLPAPGAALSANTSTNSGNADILKINPPGNHLTCINC